MKFFAILGLAAALAGCGGSNAPTTPSAVTMSGTWVGSASDSSGNMMGTGVAAGMMGGASWSLTQSGSAFSGTMRLGAQSGSMLVSGTMNGTTGTFTMTMPNGSMMMAGCTATATGTFDMDDMMQFHATYTGTNSCTGPFTQGRMTMNRQ